MAWTLRRLAVLLVASAGLCGSAIALEEHNPLDTEGLKKACTVEAKSQAEVDATNLNTLKVGRDKILAAAVGKNAIPPPENIRDKRSYLDRLADVLVPCSENAQNLPTSIGARSNACRNQTNALQKGEDLRYTDDVRAIRQNILRFFQSTLHGGNRDFRTARLLPFPTSANRQDLTTDYVPFTNRQLDDLAIIQFLFTAEGTEPFQAYCSEIDVKLAGQTVKTLRFPTGSASFPPPPASEDGPQYVVADKPAGDAGGLWNLLLKTPFKERDFPGTGNQAPADVPIAVLADTSTFAGRTKTRLDQAVPDTALSYKSKNTSKYQLVIAKDASQFIMDQAKRKGGEFGTTLPQAEDGVIDSGNVEFNADAFIGVHIRVTESVTGSVANQKDGPSYEASWAWGVTPYVGINQASQKMKLYTPNKEGVLALTEKKFDYAKLTYGGRLDYKSTLAPTPRLGSSLNTPHLLYSTGRGLRGVQAGAYAEYITDNYNLLNARKIGGYFSPPASWFGLMGNFYGSPYPIDVFQRKLTPATSQQSRYYWTDDLESGWFLSWDFAGVLEDIHHTRLPRDFEEAPCYTPALQGCILQGDSFWPRKTADEIVTGAAYGTDLSVSLGRYELLGLGKEDLFAELTAKWIYRRELDRTNSADLWNLSLKVQDPTGAESRYWKIEYVVGEDYVAGTEEERVSFKIVLAN